jgi:hypothetical protein
MHGRNIELLKYNYPCYDDFIFYQGQWAFSKVENIYDFAVNQRNPLLQLAYLGVINGAFMTWILCGIPLLPTYFIGKQHIYISYLWVAVAQYTFFLASTKEPGRINASTVASFSHQPFDGLLYIDGLHCRTCLIPKVRHCR